METFSQIFSLASKYAAPAFERSVDAGRWIREKLLQFSGFFTAAFRRLRVELVRLLCALFCQARRHSPTIARIVLKCFLQLCNAVARELRMFFDDPTLGKPIVQALLIIFLKTLLVSILDLVKTLVSLPVWSVQAILRGFASARR